MLDLQAQRKTKIVLSDYDYQQDLENRLLMSQFSHCDLLVLQEVLYSPVRFSIRKMARSLELSDNDLTDILKNLGSTGLLTINGDTVEVDKEARKYFETQVLKFEEDFKPGFDFLLGLLRQVPIHVLPSWYAIPRSSNNIHDSIIERYLHTPQIYHRYLQEFYLYNPTIAPLVKELFSSLQLKLNGQEIIDRYRLSREQFEEMMLLLEFSFIACLRYERIGNDWKEVVVPFEEWREHLVFLRSTQADPILEEEEIKRQRPHDYSFVQDLSELLKTLSSKPIPLKESPTGCFLPTSKALINTLSKRLNLSFEDPIDLCYFSKLVTKLCLLKFSILTDGELKSSIYAERWLEMPSEEQALFLYRNPHNRLFSGELQEPLQIDKAIREAEKGIQRVLHAGWVLLEDFLRGALVSFGDDPAVFFKKTGRQWAYARPQYTPEQLRLIHVTVCDWLFETAVVAIGTYKGKTCFKVTDLGLSIFGR
ncbi:MAG: hypothetical protein KGZ37_06235 [Nitrosarchaeum sp.]|nr:hypothetical protein [Nitrosarchaeum sp.]